MKIFLQIIIALFLLINVFIFTILFYPMPKVMKSLTPDETVKIYEKNGGLLYEKLNDAGRQTFIPLSQMPVALKDAFIAIEDKNFYEHSGVDLSAVFRSVWQNISAGEIVSGGSTITQQVVRNIISSGKKRTFSQKAKESILAIKISKFLDRDEIFEIYLNTIYFGGLAYGVESASWEYFNKSAINLSMAESAFLAGLPQAPNRYYPFKNFTAAKKRQEDVLSAMLRNNKITYDQHYAAKDENINLSKVRPVKKAPHFVDFVLKNFDSNAVGALKKIQTTLDLGMQERAEKILKSNLTFLTSYNIENAAVVILDVKTGDILAMIGSADYENESIHGEVNVATSLRQPGSSIKPLVYAAALEKGWTAQTVIADEPIRFNTAEGLPYEPKNFDLLYRGDVTLAEALAQSLNVPAVKTLDYAGVAPFLIIAKSFGINTFTESADHYGLSLALGSGEVRLLELTNAYSAFANKGRRAEIRYLAPEASRVLGYVPVVSPKTADTISAILSRNDLRMPAFGEENPLKFSFPVAAKTGTTRNFRDNWTIGYTDDYAVGVWVGNASGESMQGVSGIFGAAPIFYRIMNMLHETTGTVLTVGQDVRLNIQPSESGQSIVHFRADGDADGQADGDADGQADNQWSDQPDQSPADQFRIITPFSNDIYLFDPNKPAGYQKIKLEASEFAKWYVNGDIVDEGKSVLWELEKGEHRIRAIAGDEERIVLINVK